MVLAVRHEAGRRMAPWKRLAGKALRASHHARGFHGGVFAPRHENMGAVAGRKVQHADEIHRCRELGRRPAGP